MIDSANEPEAFEAPFAPGLLHRLPIAVYRSAPDGRILAANPALARLLGYSSLEELQESVENVGSAYVDPFDRERWLNQISESGEVRDFDVELRRRDGSTVWVQDSAVAIFNAEGRLLHCEGALVDVTEKVAAKKGRDEFVATISHELRNPMTVVLGLTNELAKEDSQFTGDERREIAQVLARQAEDASWIIEDLLVAHREDAASIAVAPEKFDVRREVERALEGMDMSIPIEKTGEAHVVFADPRRTRQILRNLLSNADRYGGDEKKIRVEESEGSVRVMVCDSGDPIEEEEARRIFESYERGSGLLDSRSVGLGLSVSRRLATLMNGYLEYDHDGSYSRFILTLPRAS